MSREARARQLCVAFGFDKTSRERGLAIAASAGFKEALASGRFDCVGARSRLRACQYVDECRLREALRRSAPDDEPAATALARWLLELTAPPPEVAASRAAIAIQATQRGRQGRKRVKALRGGGASQQ